MLINAHHIPCLSGNCQASDIGSDDVSDNKFMAAVMETPLPKDPSI